MTIQQTLKAIRDTGCTAKWNADLKEYRVNLKGGSEATAYYTEDAEDAVNTARAMNAYAEELNSKSDAINHTPEHSFVGEGYCTICKHFDDSCTGTRDEEDAQCECGRMTHECLTADGNDQHGDRK